MDLYKGIEPVWTKENREKKEGSTTFVKCGWCEYTGTSTKIHDCALKSRCSLLSEYKPENDWIDDCKYKKLTREEKFEIIDSKLFSIKESSEEIKRTEEQIHTILKEMKL